VKHPQTSFGAKGGELKKVARVNLEQPLTAGKEFGGHFVLGHVDTIGRVRISPRRRKLVARSAGPGGIHPLRRAERLDQH